MSNRCLYICESLPWSCGVKPKILSYLFKCVFYVFFYLGSIEESRLTCAVEASLVMSCVLRLFPLCPVSWWSSLCPSWRRPGVLLFCLRAFALQGLLPTALFPLFAKFSLVEASASVKTCLGIPQRVITTVQSQYIFESVSLTVSNRNNLGLSTSWVHWQGEVQSFFGRTEELGTELANSVQNHGKGQA